MVEHGQINLRVPDNAKDILKDIADKIRRDATFLPRLRRFVREDNGERSALLEGRMDRLEKRVAELEAREEVPIPIISRPSQAPQPRQIGMFGGDEAETPQAAGATGGWTQGEGKGRRLTDAGKEEVRRLISAGQRDSDIAKTLGVHAVSVGRIRAKMPKG